MILTNLTTLETLVTLATDDLDDSDGNILKCNLFKKKICEISFRKYPSTTYLLKRELFYIQFFEGVHFIRLSEQSAGIVAKFH